IISIVEHGHIWDTNSFLLISPSSYYKMNDNEANTVVLDAMENNNGTAQQNTCLISSSTGKINGALEFNGSTDYISLPSSVSDDIVDNITISAWVYSNTLLETSEYRAIVSEAYDGDGNVEFELYLDGANHNLSAGFYNGSWHTVAETTAFPLNQWVYVTVSYDGSYIHLYRDAEEVISSSDLSLSLPSGTNGWRIGRRHDLGGASDMWNGTIDDVRIYNTTLSADEISNIYNSGVGLEDTISPRILYTQLGTKSTTGSFSSSLTSLSEETTYYVISYVDLSDGSTIYGDEISFATLAEIPPKYNIKSGGDGGIKLRGDIMFR
ncbi:MAG: LamG domain-containing protein, partial [Candidatus Pacebacteria bacterium]|nr:LamG domain-containing protein [Candidatus Paceibacterota bacterium]